jgi:hypothetical protein
MSVAITRKGSINMVIHREAINLYTINAIYAIGLYKRRRRCDKSTGLPVDYYIPPPGTTIDVCHGKRSVPSSFGWNEYGVSRLQTGVVCPVNKNIAIADGPNIIRRTGDKWNKTSYKY